MKIAICGKMCSGKSTLANYIMSSYPGYQKYSFAQKVKELCSELFDMKGKDRPLLINFANKMREIDGKVWINQVLKQTEGKEKCIIDDVRYQNEVDALIEDDWSFIQLNVPILTQRERIMELYPDNYQEHIQSMNHISEKNEFVFPEGYPQLVLDTSESNYHKNIQEVNLFMKK
jgi:deoxyadenosine/deoxycytidine kinase